ncbi:MAG: ABC transporter permease [Desulfurococcaceae archaeon]
MHIALGRYLIRKFFSRFLVFMAILTITFIIPRLMPGGAFAYLLENPNISPEFREALIRQFGLDKPILEQYVLFLREFFLSGNLGISFYYRKPVMSVILDALPWTILLVTGSTIVSVILGMLAGLAAAAKRASVLDRAFFNVSMFFRSMPAFWLALVLLIFFSYYLDLFPLYGAYTYGRTYESFFEYIADVAYHLALPFMTLTILTTSAYLVLSRNLAIDVLTEDFIITAKAKGLPERTILYRHTLRPILTPLMTMTAIELGYSIGGALMIETVFSLPGVGKLMYDAILMTDYPVLLGIVIMTSAVTLVLVTLVEIFAAIIDPRVMLT